MFYIDKLITVYDGLKLYVPDPQLVRSTYERLLAEDAATPFPFWTKIWPSARAMSLFLQEEPQWIKDKHVLELGAGIALPSFAAAYYAREMIISDHAAEAVALIEKNIQYLGLQHIKAMLIDWNHFPDNIHAETVLLSDVNYAPGQFGPLLLLIRKLLDEGATVILSTPQRITITPFAEAIQPFVKRSVLQTIHDAGQATDICILVLSL